jgi:hypothetical protein
MKTKRQISTQIEVLRLKLQKFDGLVNNLEVLSQELIDNGHHTGGENLYGLTKEVYQDTCSRYRAQIKALEFVLNDKIEAL